MPPLLSCKRPTHSRVNLPNLLNNNIRGAKRNNFHALHCLRSSPAVTAVQSKSQQGPPCKNLGGDFIATALHRRHHQTAQSWERHLPQVWALPPLNSRLPLRHFLALTRRCPPCVFPPTVAARQGFRCRCRCLLIRAEQWGPNVVVLRLVIWHQPSWCHLVQPEPRICCWHKGQTSLEWTSGCRPVNLGPIQPSD